MSWRQVIPCTITALVLLAACLGALRSLESQFVLAAELVFLAAAIDGIDGEIARRLRGVTAFGARLDTYVDVISFGFVPALLAYQAFWSRFEFVGAAFAFLIVLCGVIRFSKGRSSVETDKGHAFRGLPIPVNAVWISVTVILAEAPEAFGLGDAPGIPLMVAAMWVCSVLFSLLQVTNIPYRKPRREAFLIAMALIVVFMVVSGQPRAVLGGSIAVSLFWFAFLSPLSGAARRAEADQDVAVSPRP